MSRSVCDLSVERELLQRHRVLGAIDECGRGCLGSVVSTGVVVIDATAGEPPEGVADSKELTAAAREALVGPIRDWALASAVGHASASEIDEIGITAALRLAANRALDEIASFGVRCGAVLLDGPHDWLSAPSQYDMFDEEVTRGWSGEVTCLVKADARCAAVAAASVLAKVERDAIVAELEEQYPGYGWSEHKGYGTPGHLAAIEALGPCVEHRLSWAPFAAE